MSQESPISSLLGAGQRIAKLYIANARLTAAEKATVLISAAAIAFIGGLLGLVALLFIVIGIANWLASYIEPFWTYFIVAGIFIVAIALIVVFRIQLVYNPVARFMSKLFLDPPTSEKNDK